MPVIQAFPISFFYDVGQPGSPTNILPQLWNIDGLTFDHNMQVDCGGSGVFFQFNLDVCAGATIKAMNLHITWSKEDPFNDPCGNQNPNSVVWTTLPTFSPIFYFGSSFDIGSPVAIPMTTEVLPLPAAGLPYVLDPAFGVRLDWDMARIDRLFIEVYYTCPEIDCCH
jgi:hypothetical protein